MPSKTAVLLITLVLLLPHCAGDDDRTGAQGRDRRVGAATTTTGSVAASMATTAPTTTTTTQPPTTTTVATVPTWQALPAAPVNAQAASLVAAHGGLYLAGGQTRIAEGVFEPVADQHRFDPATNQWRAVASLPVPVNHVQPVVVGGRIFYIGGLQGWPGPATGAVQIYDPATDTFSQGTPMPRPRGSGGTVVVGGLVYVLGGVDGQVAVPWVDRYDPATGVWTALPDLPEPRDHFQAMVHGTNIHIAGGRDRYATALITSHIRLDTTTGQWSTDLAPVPVARGASASVSLPDGLLVLGGERRNPGQAFRNVDRFDPTTGQWSSLPPMPEPRHDFGAATCGPTVVVAGGSETPGERNPLRSVYAFNLPTTGLAC